MTAAQVPSRAEIPESDKWDLAHLFTDVSKWTQDFHWVQQTHPQLVEWKGRLGESAATLREALEFDKTIDQKLERVYHFASLQLAEDSAHPEYLARMGQLQNLLTQMSEASAFFVPELQAISDEKFAQMLDHPALAEWRTNLRKIRRMKLPRG